jgi:hypothetical protein
MSHIVPILCLIAFIWILEIRLKKEIIELKEQLSELQKHIKMNEDNIIINKQNIEKING